MMNKKNKIIIRAISWKKNPVERLFCKHEYQYYTNNNPLLVSGQPVYHICKKCGKYDKTLFWEYEGMGFK